MGRTWDSLDLIAVYWMGDAVAHTIVSFGFEGEHIAISIEIRKERGESFSTKWVSPSLTSGDVIPWRDGKCKGSCSWG